MIPAKPRLTANAPEGRYEEIVVRLVPSRQKAYDPSHSRRESGGETTRAYDALVYTSLKLDWLLSPEAVPSDRSLEIDKFPLAAVEHVIVGWSRYREYLEAFLEGEKAAHYMRSQLLKTMSPGLERLFAADLPTSRPVRMWWSSETPELEELPWELVAYASRSYTEGEFSFVRGLPGEWAPLVPLEQPKLRLAFIHNLERTPVALRDALSNLQNVDVVPITAPPREALHRAGRDRFELVHLVAGGQVSLAAEGILELFDHEESTRLAPSELSSLLFGSRVSVLGLTPAEVHTASFEEIPTVYRAFTFLGKSRHALPTIVSPLGPLPESRLHEFWRSFYEGLAETLSVEDAVIRGQTGGSPSPMALFLRHRLGREFIRKPTWSPADEVQPTQINAELQVSRSFLDELHAVDSKYSNLEDNVTGSSLVEKESKRQDRLDDALTAYRDLSGGQQ